MTDEEKREIILAHNSNPFHRETKDETYLKVNSNNASCIDNINLYLKIKDDVIEELYFDGEACAISTGATSIMIQELVGKKVSVAEEFIRNYENMINHEDYDEKILKEANVFNETYKQQNRKTCALIPYIGLKKALTEYKEE